MRIITSQVRLGLAVLSALLLNLCFPIAGPLPAWRTIFAWFGAVPLLLALVCSDEGSAPIWQGVFHGCVAGGECFVCGWLHLAEEVVVDWRSRGDGVIGSGAAMASGAFAYRGDSRAAAGESGRAAGQQLGRHAV